METIRMLSEYYDPHTRLGLCNMVLEFVYYNKIEDIPDPSIYDIIKTVYYLTIGRVISPKTSSIYVNVFNMAMNDEEQLDTLIKCNR